MEDDSECDEACGCVEIGDVLTHDGHSIVSPIDRVRWFLDHGFKVW